MKPFLRLAVCALVVGAATTALAQVLDIETDNGVFYVYDTTDLSAFATLPGVVPPWSGGPSRKNFFSGVFIADIVSVNGQPARGVMVRRGTRVGLARNQAPGQAISDTIRGYIDDVCGKFRPPRAPQSERLRHTGLLVGLHLQGRRLQPPVPTSQSQAEPEPSLGWEGN
jgi:hypothetical protein